MPGSIQVSVLDFKELPSSSNSVKVSLGKVEHEAEKTGTYSFPLTNLRDNLIISIYDSEGNQISHSGIRTMSIIEKGTWDDLFPIEGGGIIHMKLQFILSDEERNRIRSMREAAMKKKQEEILGSKLRKTESAKSLTSLLQRHEISDVLRDTSSQDFRRSSSNSDYAKARILTPLDDIYGKDAESSNVKESFQTFTDSTDRKEETLSPPIEIMHQRVSPNDVVKKSEKEKPKLLDDLEEKNPSDIKITSQESTSTSSIQEIEVNTIKNNEIQLQETELNTIKNKEMQLQEGVSQKEMVVDMKNLEEKIPIYIKKTSQESKPSSISQETQVNSIKNNEKRLQETSSQDMTSSRSNIFEKIKSFSPNIAGKQENQGTLEKTPRNIKKMISVFESSISQDKTPLKPLSTKSYKVGSLRFLKDHDNDERLKTSSSTRLRNSFSMSDLRENLVVTKEEQDGFEKFVEPSEINDSKGIGNLVNNEEKFTLVEMNTKKLPEASEEDATISGRMPSHNEKERVNGEMTSKDNSEYLIHDSDSKIQEKDHEESIPEIFVKGKMHRGSDDIMKQGEETVHVSENSTTKSTDEEASNGSLGQVVKIAMVVGFGVLVFLLRQREPGKSKKKENNRPLKNQEFMNRRGSIEELRKIGVMRIS